MTGNTLYIHYVRKGRQMERTWLVTTTPDLPVFNDGMPRLFDPRVLKWSVGLTPWGAKLGARSWCRRYTKTQSPKYSYEKEIFSTEDS